MSEHPIDLSKLKKDPARAGFYYAPVTVSKEMLAASSKFADLVRQQHDAAIAQLQDRLAQPMVFVTPSAPAQPAKLSPAGARRFDKLRREFTPLPGTPVHERTSAMCVICAKRWGDHLGFACDDPSAPVVDGSLGEAGRASLKHGPGGRGGSGPCDPDCWKCALENAARDPLDVKHDGVTLRVLLVCDESNRREFGVATSFGPIPVRASLTPAQRAAISAHWSAELRAKVAASAERDHNRVLVDLQDEP